MLVLLCLFQYPQSMKILKRSRNANKGYLLMELLLALTVGSLIIISFYTTLNFVVNSCKFGDIENEILLNSRYAIEYIKRDIKTADKVMDINIIPGLNERYKNNIGFVVMKYNPNLKSEMKYNYSTYYLEDDNLYRAAANRGVPKYPRYTSFSGKNLVAEFVVSIDETKVDWEKQLISLSFLLGGENIQNTEFKTNLKIRCPIDYKNEVK